MFRVIGALLMLVLAVPATADAQTSEARLAWDAPSTPDVVGYIIQYGTRSGVYSQSLNVGLQTEHLVQGLVDGGTYYFAVRAYDSSGVQSPTSNEVVFTTPAACNIAFSKSSTLFAAVGGAGSVVMTTGAGCNWNVASNAAWLTATSGSGSGSATVNFNVAPNMSKSPRTGILYSGNRSVLVTQGGRMRSDFNGDGRNDLIWQNMSTGATSVWRMNGINLASGDYLTPNSVGDLNWKIMGTMDADRDGNVDLVLQHDAGQVAIWRMVGETRVETVTLTDSVASEPRWRIVGTGDMDRDDSDDIIWQHADGRVAVWYMNGLAKREMAVIATVSDARWRVAAMEDFNGDGKLDILWHHAVWGQLLVWNMDDRQYLSNGMNLIMANSLWKVVATGDFDGDGKTDLVWRNTSSGELATWLLDGVKILGGRALNPGRVSDTSWQVVGPR